MQFELITTFGWLSLMMVVGSILRAKVKLLQKSLVPTSIIGGVAGLILVNLGLIKVDFRLLSQIVFHLFVISFIAIGLMDGHANNEGQEKVKLTKNPMFKGAFAMACMFQGIFCVQSVLGYGVIKGLNIAGLTSALPVYGLLTPTGMALGPGQASVAGSIFAAAGLEKGVAVGLAFAAVGFLGCFLVGIPVANYGIRKGLAKGAGHLSDEFLSGIIKRESEKESAGEITFHSANVETFSIHFGIIMICYLMAYYMVQGIVMFVPAQVGAALVGTMFIFGLVSATICKKVIKTTNTDHLVNPDLMKRIAGWAIDFMVLTTIMAVQVETLGEYLIPIIIVFIIALPVTGIIMYHFGRRIGGDIDFERTLGIFGVATGTMNTGLLLLRMVDPDYKTDASKELALHILINDTILGGVPLVFVGLGPAMFGWTHGFTLIVMSGLALMFFALIPIFKLYNKPTFSIFGDRKQKNEQELVIK
ncbi:glutamate:Na+ symporter, ESS family [Dethiosulfatibacter aminovorans DSM 17477]|uniref:Glutamate:Na+ symporter, ESS family n=1 Tax=Dethiosulfatibacter aminovorans DSM 17477 TaxID=1121476 RepID=A0A1M6EHZ6_9FIRM|nr:sodium/glutamate symporter [Dethiosulfatibacter aminovorans]SHI85127.1 glutamate:Na+ symporter, ESS family [Dethiosulfatibacter aminovorans DSM 17477]